MVFTSDGVVIVLRSAERYDPAKTALSESEAEGRWGGGDKPITMLDSKHCDWLVLPLLLATPTIYSFP